MDANRTARLDAFKAVRVIVEDHRGVTLFGPEADDIMWAAEGMLLAGSTDEPDAVDAREMFTRRMDELTAHRWSEDKMGPTAERLRKAFDECAPVALVSA